MEDDAPPPEELRLVNVTNAVWSVSRHGVALELNRQMTEAELRDFTTIVGNAVLPAINDGNRK